MKKKFLLAIIPALLAMSSCTYMQSATAVKGNGLLEDCLAHDELFGNAELQEVEQEAQREIQPLRSSDPGFDPEENATPYIGVQSFVADGKVSFRFVAAVRFESAAAREQTAVTWHRSVTSPSGAFVKEEGVDAVPECNTAYLALNNNGTSYSIDDFNDDHNDSNYTHFVVYTLRNVSLTTYAGHYVSAYLSFSKTGESGIDPVSSKAIAINVERTEKHTYDASNGYCYLDGTFGGTPRKVEASKVRNGSNKAEFEFIDFAAGDVFTINEFWNTKFFVHGSQECLEYDGNNDVKERLEDDGTSAHKIKVKADKEGSYGLYLNVTDNKLYVSGPYNYYVSGSMNGWAKKPGSAYYMSRPTSGNTAVSKTISFAKDDEFKVRDGDTWYDVFDGSEDNTFKQLGGGNIQCLTAGDYIVYLNDSNHIWVAKA